MKNFILHIALFCFACTSCSESSVQENESYELEKDQTKKAYYESQMKHKGFSLELNGDCDDALEDTLHERRLAYVDTQIVEKSGRVVEFRFKEACCQEFLGDYTVNNDTLKFELEQVNDGMCSCICWYRYKLDLMGIMEDYNVIEIGLK